MIIDTKEFYLLCAQACRTHAVVLCNRDEFVLRMTEEDEYCKRKGFIPEIWMPFANAGYQNFISKDEVFYNDGSMIFTLFEVVG